MGRTSAPGGSRRSPLRQGSRPGHPQRARPLALDSPPLRVVGKVQPWLRVAPAEDDVRTQGGFSASGAGFTPRWRRYGAVAEAQAGWPCVQVATALRYRCAASPGCLAGQPAPFDAFLPTSLELLQAERTIVPGLASCRERLCRARSGRLHAWQPWPPPGGLRQTG